MVLHMERIEGDMRMAMGSSKLMEPDGADRALQVLHGYSAPDASRAISTNPWSAQLRKVLKATTQLLSAQLSVGATPRPAV